MLAVKINNLSHSINNHSVLRNINLDLERGALVSVKIYNITGQLVDVIADGFYNPSSYHWTWNAENLASGVYFVTQQVGSDIHTEKIMLLK